MLRGGLTLVTLFQPRLTDQLWAFPASSLPGIWALKGARVEEKEGYHFMWRSGPIGSEWVDLGGTVNKGRGSSLVPKRKESPTDQGRAFLGIFMMRMRRHHEFMCVSLTCTDHLFSKHWCVQSRDVLLSICVCDAVWWIVLPLHKAIWVFVYSLLYSFCIGGATDGEWWTGIKKLKHTAFLPHS